MLLSIVIPHYNLPRHLLESCLRSITSQGLPDGSYEVIIVDDGSETTPSWILDTFAKAPVRLKTIRHGGLSEARNAGLDEAAGEYIMFVDSDDTLQPDSLKRVITTLQKEHPQILRYQFNICKNDNDTHIGNKKEYKTSEATSGAAYMAMNNLKGSACLYFFSKQLATKHNIRFISGIYHEDEDFTTRLHYHAKTVIDSNAIVYNYFTRRGSITTSSDKEANNKRIADHLTIIKELAAFGAAEIQQSVIQTKGLERKLSMLAVDLIIKMFRSGKKTEDVKRICDEELRPLGLYPLPNCNPTGKYRIFQKLAKSTIGLHILRFAIVHTNK